MTDAEWFVCDACGAKYRNETLAGMCCGGAGSTEVVGQ